MILPRRYFPFDSDAPWPLGLEEARVSTDLFTIMEPKNQAIDLSELHKLRRSTDSKTLKSSKGQPG